MNNLMQGMVSIYLQQALNNKIINVKGSVKDTEILFILMM